MPIPKSRLSQLFADLNRHVQAIDVTERALTQLRDDVLLQQRGITIHFAVDFAEIHVFGHQASRAWLVQELPDDDQDAMQVRGQLSLAYLFSDLFPELLLLPPYVIEFTEHLDRLRAKVPVVATEVIARRTALERTLRSRLLNPQVAELVGRYRDGRDMSPADSHTIAEFALSNFKEAYAWLSLVDSAAATDRMLATLQRKKVVTFSSRFKEIDGGDHLLEERAEILHSLITRERGGRSYQSFVDGLACGYVEGFNARHSQSNESLVLITHSPAMHTAVAEALTREKLPASANYLRDLNYALAKLAHSTPSGTTDQDRLEDSLNRLQKFAEVRRQIEDAKALCESADSDPGDEAIEMAVRVLSDADTVAPELRGMLERAENRSLIIGRGGEPLWQDASQKGHDTTSQTRVSKFIMNLVGTKHEEVLREIRSQSDQLWDRIDVKGTQLADSSRDLYYIMCVGTKSAEAVDSISKSQGTAKQIVLASLPGEPPLAFELRHSQTQRVALAFERLKGRATRETARQFQESLLQLMSLRKQNAIESHFLIAYVLAALQEWEEALDWLNRGLQDGRAVVPQSYPLVLLRCVILRRLWRSPEALAACHEALNTWPEDPAVLREWAVVTWQQNRELAATSEAASRYRFLDEAIEIAKRAEKSAEKRASSTHLRAQALNTLAYLLAERGELEDVHAAAHCLNQLSGVLPRDKWGGRFNDTAALVTFLRAKLLPESDERRRLVTTALRFSGRALSDEGLSADERRLVVQHRYDLDLFVEGSN